MALVLDHERRKSPYKLRTPTGVRAFLHRASVLAEQLVGMDVEDERVPARLRSPPADDAERGQRAARPSDLATAGLRLRSDALSVRSRTWLTTVSTRTPRRAWNAASSTL
jgi:hypothetical protein